VGPLLFLIYFDAIT